MLLTHFGERQAAASLGPTGPTLNREISLSELISEFMASKLALEYSMWCVCKQCSSFIHSGYFYNSSSSPPPLRGVPDTARMDWLLCRNFTPKRHRQLSKGLAQDPYVARAGVEAMTLRTKGVDSTNVPHTHHIGCMPRTALV